MPFKAPIEAKNQWSLTTSKLINHCIEIGSKQVITDINTFTNGLMQLENFNSDLDRFEVIHYTDNCEVIATEDVPRGTIISIPLFKHIHVSTHLDLPDGYEKKSGDAIVKWYNNFKVEANVELIVTRDIKSNKYSLHAKTITDIYKDQKLVVCPDIEVWLLSKYLCPRKAPNYCLSQDQINVLEAICIDQIGNSLKRASIVHFNYIQSLH